MNEGSYMIRRGSYYLQRDSRSPALCPRDEAHGAWFGAKSTARRFTTRDVAERFILKVLGHSHDLKIVHLLPRGTIARRERRTVKEAIERALKDVHGPVRFALERIVEELS